MIEIHQIDQLFAQPFDLSVVQNPDAGQIAVLVEKSNLLFAQSIAIPSLPVDRRNKQIADRFMIRG